MTENFPKLMSKTKLQVEEAQRTPSIVNNKNCMEAYYIQTTENQREAKKS